MAIWNDILNERDRKVYGKAAYGKKIVLGTKPALLIVDVVYLFVGDKPEPILKSIERYPKSCGESGWQAIQNIASLLETAREREIPIFYSTKDEYDPKLPYSWTSRNPTSSREVLIRDGYNIVQEVAPTNRDIVISKPSPSIFFGTNLIGMLVPLGVDTVLVCGGSTSGCVRASVVDAASYGFKVGVIEECTFDRFEISHKVSLFEMDAKYANVMKLTDAQEYLARIS